jgi:RNA polymerase sigma-32 factor
MKEWLKFGIDTIIYRLDMNRGYPMNKASTALHDPAERRYIAAAMRAPMLEREYEVELGKRWRDREDESALDELVESHVRLAVKIASGFKGYGLPLNDLIQEGTVGLIQAARRFDPDREVRFSTYASWWILAAVQEFIIRNSSIVRIGTTPAQKSLFFNLRRLRAKIAADLVGPMSDDERRIIAGELNVPLPAVERMEAHFSAPDRSLNAFIGEEERGDALQDLLPDERPTPEETVTENHDRAFRNRWLHKAIENLTGREQEIIRKRFLGEKKSTLAEIGEQFGVTKERIRQIESRALKKLKASLKEGTTAPELFGNA